MTTLQEARTNLQYALEALQRAQDAYIRASDAWIDAVEENARGVRAVCGEGETEKGRGSVGPHTNAGEAKGRVVHDYHCDWWISGPCTCGIATHHATHTTQVLGNKGPDTTSHG